MSLTAARDDDGGVGGGIGGGTPTPTPTPAPSPTPTPSPTSPVPPAVTPPTSAIVPAIIASLERSGGSIGVARIPLSAIPAQRLTVQLGDQSCVLQVYQKSTGLYLDLIVNSAVVIQGALCRDRVWIVRDGYLGFAGDLAFVDTQSASDPYYTELADRFHLLWGH